MTGNVARMLPFEVPVDDQWHEIVLPYGAKPLHVDCRKVDVVEFWAESWMPPGKLGSGQGDDGQRRQFRVFGTGHPYDPDEAVWQGTVVAPGGSLVWHLYVKREPAGVAS